MDPIIEMLNRDSPMMKRIGHDLSMNCFVAKALAVQMRSALSERSQDIFFSILL